MKLTAFLEDRDNCSREHEFLIRECAKIFIRRMDTVAITEIISSASHLTRILRDEATERWTMLEVVEEELKALRTANQAQSLAMLQVKKQEYNEVFSLLKEEQAVILAQTKEKMDKMNIDFNLKTSSMKRELMSSFDNLANVQTNFKQNAEKVLDEILSVRSQMITIDKTLARDFKTLAGRLKNLELNVLNEVFEKGVNFKNPALLSVSSV